MPLFRESSTFLAATRFGVQSTTRLAAPSRASSASTTSMPAARIALAYSSVELGRESCRERVCQYVSTAAVVVSLKHKYPVYYSSTSVLLDVDVKILN